MKTATPFGKNLPILGQYAYGNCANCGKEQGNWFTGIYGYVDCDCTLPDGFKFRTELKLPTPTPDKTIEA